MKIYNTKNSFGAVAILLHWLVAIAVIGLFILGKYMLSLDYYDPFYHEGPWWHKSFGLLVTVLLFARIMWRISNPQVEALSTHKAWEIRLSSIIKWLMYLLMILACISGYMISTAEDAGIEFFKLFEVPAIVANGESQAQLAGAIHEYSTLVLIILASLHLLAALKHHFIDKDKTLLRIISTKINEEKNEN